MANRLSTRSGNRIASRRKLAAESLKRCPLCGAVNARLNGECFVCRWHGEFDHDPARIEAGVTDLIFRCPELADAILQPPQERRATLRERIAAVWARLTRRRLDLQA